MTQIAITQCLAHARCDKLHSLADEPRAFIVVRLKSVEPSSASSEENIPLTINSYITSRLNKKL